MEKIPIQNKYFIYLRKLFKKYLTNYIVVRHRVRVVKEIDLKSIGLCPRRFEPCRCRFIYLILIIDYWIQNLKLYWFVDYRGKVVYKVVFPSLVKGVRLKIECIMLRGFKSHRYHCPFSSVGRAQDF